MTTDPSDLEPIQPDEHHTTYDDTDTDEGNDSASGRSSLTSVTSSILKGRLGEGRRTYAVYGKEEYGFPMDDQELERMDYCHAKYYALLDKKTYLAPIGDHPQRIVDIGCGTGIWAIEMADRFPGAQVVGVDIAPTQPAWVPPNCQFELDDIEQPWTFGENQADFIFARDLIVAIRDFPALFEQAYKHLKPGGWIEFQCVQGTLRCDDGSTPKDSKIQLFSDHLMASTLKFATPVDDPSRWKRQMEAQGFTNVTEKVYKMPLTPWTKDARLKVIGLWEQVNLLQNLEGMTMRLFSKGLDWSEEEITVFGALLRRDLHNLNYHCYWPFYTVYAQKPL